MKIFYLQKQGARNIYRVMVKSEEKKKEYEAIGYEVTRITDG